MFYDALATLLKTFLRTLLTPPLGTLLRTLLKVAIEDAIDDTFDYAFDDAFEDCINDAVNDDIYVAVEGDIKIASEQAVDDTFDEAIDEVIGMDKTIDNSFSLFNFVVLSWLPPLPPPSQTFLYIYIYIYIISFYNFFFFFFLLIIIIIKYRLCFRWRKTRLRMVWICWGIYDCNVAPPVNYLIFSITWFSENNIASILLRQSHSTIVSKYYLLASFHLYKNRYVKTISHPPPQKNKVTRIKLRLAKVFVLYDWF